MEIEDKVEVLCVRAIWTPGANYNPHWWPVMGSFHTDESQDFPPIHYHVDYRFLTEPQALKSRVEANGSNGKPIPTACYHAPLMGRLIVPEGEETKI